MTDRAGPVGRGELLLYALPWFYVQVVTLPLVNFVPGYYASDLGIPLLQVSLVMLLARGLDIVTDPLIGTLSDRTRSPMGRRKPWIIAGVPVLMAGAWLLFVPARDADAVSLFVAVGLTYLGFTMIQITYAAWGAELSGDYDGRSRIAGWREGVGMLGTICAISSPLVAQSLFGGGLGEAMYGVAIAVLVLAPLLTLPAMLFVRQSHDSLVAEAAIPLRQGLQAVRDNRAFLIFAAGLFFIFFGVAPPGALSYLLFKEVFEAEDLFAWSVLATWIPTILFLPFWLWMSKRIGKHRVLVTVLAYCALANILYPAIYALRLDPMWAVAHSAVTGIGLGALLTLPYSMIADIIDEDTVRTGAKRSGLYMALGGVILKFALMLGVALGLAWPALFGFEAGVATNSDFAKLQVTIGASWITALAYAAGAYIFSRYPITRDRQAELRAEIEQRHGAAPALPV